MVTLPICQDVSRTELRVPELALDLFAGARGWSVGAHRLGIVDHGVEIMREACLTAAHAGFVTIHDDVWTLPARYLPHYTGGIGSPPCQTFSVGGKGSGRKALVDVLRCVPHVANWSRSRLRKVGAAFGDDRTALVLTPLWYALNMPNARWLAWEQVPTVLPVWEACAEVLRARGWHVWTGHLNAEQFGVPQTRKRAFLIASRDREVGRPEPTHSRYYSHDPDRLDLGVAPWISMAEALGWVDDGHMISNYSTGGDTSNPGIRRLDQPAPTVTSKINRNKVVKLANRRDSEAWVAQHGTRPNRSADNPAPTITGEAHRWSWIAEGDSVRLTVAEAGVLQSFPPDYDWQGKSGKQFLQAGNAVPPLLARAVLAEATGIELEADVESAIAATA